MRLHGNGRLSVKGRELLIAPRVSGWPGIGRRGLAGCLIGPRPPRLSQTAPMNSVFQVISALRRLRLTGLEIAECLTMAHSTVSGIGTGKFGRLGLEPAQRYERERPGELIHIDVKKLGRIQGGAGKYWRSEPRQQSRHWGGALTS